jgi:transposase
VTAQSPSNVLGMMKIFRPYSLEQQLLLPPDLREWVPEDDLVWFISDTVDVLDLSAIVDVYDHGDGRGQPPYHPAMMVKLLLYAYCSGMPSSRKIERATHRDVAFRALTADQHPDHDSIAEFRQRHLSALATLFVQVLRLCQAAGLVTLGHVALDGTKIKAHASRHKAMSYARMADTERRLQEEVRRLLDEAERVDAAEDATFGPDRRGDEVPAELARRETRLAKIRALKAVLEKEAREGAAQAADAARAKLAAREQRTGRQQGRPAKVPDPAQARLAPTAQRNFTDPESRIMKDTATDSFIQGYTAEAAADSHQQIVIACGVTNAAQDVEQFGPLLAQIATHVGQRPAVITADAGFFSEANLSVAAACGIEAYIPPDRDRHGIPPGAGPPADHRRGRASERMRAKLRTPMGEAIYRRRKAIIEPVFAYIKDRRGFRRFSFRGLAKVSAEWSLICLTHNLLKLYRARPCAQPV